MCLEDAIGVKPKLVKVARIEDMSTARNSGSYDRFIVLLEDLTE